MNTRMAAMPKARVDSSLAPSRVTALAMESMRAGKPYMGLLTSLRSLAHRLVSLPTTSAIWLAELVDEGHVEDWDDPVWRRWITWRHEEIERFRGFLDVLSSNDRLSLLPEIRALFQELRAEAENRLRVKVVSAVPLDEDQAGRLTAALASRFECEIELDNEIDAEVIGGAVVYAGDQVIDGSLRGRLNKLSNSLAN